VKRLGANVAIDILCDIVQNATLPADEMLKENFLDTRFAGTTPVLDGYVYTMKVIPKSTAQQPGYTVNTDPQVSEGVGATGRNHYYVDSDTNTIHVNATQPATAADPPIGG